jgi:hypothetical protein
MTTRKNPKIQDIIDALSQEEEVGYSKPPKATRFQKGQSGNPKGRPRKKKEEKSLPKLTFADAPSHRLFEEEVYRLLKLTENGKPLEMTAAQAVMRSMFGSALKGNRISQRYLLERIEREDQEAQATQIARYERYKRLKAEGEERIAQARDKGEEPPALYPHPEDILLVPAHLEVHVLGPTSPEEVAPYKLQCAYRDAGLAMASEGLHKYDEDSPEAEQRRAIGVVSGLLNLALPPSMRFDEDEEIRFMMEWASLTKKEFAARFRELRDFILNNPPSPQAVLDEREGARRALNTLLEGLLDKLQDHAHAPSHKKSSGGRT